MMFSVGWQAEQRTTSEIQIQPILTEKPSYLCAAGKIEILLIRHHEDEGRDYFTTYLRQQP